MDFKEVKTRLKRHFSSWKPANIIVTDAAYDDVSAKELQSAITYIPAKGDCDDYARELWCYLRHLHPQWPVGICLLKRVAGVKTNHAMVVCVCMNNVYLIEPQTVWDIGLAGMQKMWEADTKKDRFYFTYI